MGTHKFDLQTVDIPTPGSDEILLKNMTSGLCGTDVHIYNGDAPGLAAPGTTLGHEFAGIVEAVGKNITEFQKGDRIAVEPNLFCGQCHFCRQAKKHFCENWSAIGLGRHGGFQEYTLIPPQAAYLMPENLSFEQAAFFEPMACVLHGIERARVSPGETVVLLGAGSIGLLYIQALRQVGATSVIVSEPAALKRKLAKELGATTVVDPTKESLEEIVKAETNGLGANVLIDAAGLLSSIDLGLKVLENTGRILIFGVPPENTPTEIVPFEIYRREIEIIGSFTNPYTNEAALKFLTTTKVDEIISHKISLDNLEEMVKQVLEKEPGIIKVQVQFQTL